MTIDAVSQRFNRASHDFGDYEVPEAYCVDVAMSPVALDMCKEFRKLEDEMVDEQRRNPRRHAEFLQHIQVFARNLEDARVSKRNIRLAELSRTGQRAKERREREAIADRDPRFIEFKRWLRDDYKLRNGQPYDESTQKTYCGIVRRLFFDEEEDIEVIVECAKDKVRKFEALPERGPEVQNKYQALKRFIEHRRARA